MAVLPTTNLTLHCDASDTDQLSTGFVGSGTPPDGIAPIDGGVVQGWDDEGDGIADVALRWANGNANQKYRTCPHLMKHPCIDFDGENDGFFALNQDGTTNPPLSSFISASSWMVAVAIYPETIADVQVDPWQNDAIFGCDGFIGPDWGLTCRNVSGVKQVRGYHRSGGDIDSIAGTISEGRSWVVIFSLSGDFLHMTVIAKNGTEVTSTPVASGDTQELDGFFSVATRQNLRFFNGRIGEFAVYDTALTGTNLTNLKTYFRDKWLGAVTEEVECGGAPEFGVIGPLAWWLRRKRLTDGTVVTTPHSDQDMQCPADYYEGFKEGTVIEFGDAERAASDPVTGDWRGSTFRLRQADTDRTLLAEFASAQYRYWVGNNPVYMTTRANRALLGNAYCVFNGPIIDAQPRGLAWDITLGDVISRQLLSDQALIPWRQFKDSNLSEFIEVSETLDREGPEQIILGQHSRVPDVDPPSPQGFIYTPTLMGKFEIAADAWWCWQVCGHATADIPDVYTIEQTADGPEPPSSIIADEGTVWLIPHYTGHTAQFGAPYEDVTSDTYGDLLRVTRIYGKVGEADPDACAMGTKVLAVSVEGVEPNGDGSGDVITDRIQQYKYIAINYLAHSGAESYRTGPPLTNPVWDLPEGPLGIIDEDAFDAVSAIAEARLPSFGSPVLYPAGYIGAGIIGAHAGDRSSATKWIAEFNKSCGVRQGIDHFGRFTIGMLHPTQAIKDAAPLITDEFVVIKGTFETPIFFTQQANRQPFETDYEHVTGRWMTSGIADSADSIANYDRIILGDLRQFRFAPGSTMAYHLALMAVRENEHPPRGVALEATIGPDPNGDSLGYLDLFDYFRYRHFASISDTAGTIRLAWIIKHQVLAGKRRVRPEAIDVDDLIYFDAPPFDDSSGGGSPGGSPGPPAESFSGDVGPTEDITCP